jgi:hypothetical protein
MAGKCMNNCAFLVTFLQKSIFATTFYSKEYLLIVILADSFICKRLKVQIRTT